MSVRRAETVDRQCGVALITVLLVVAVLTAIVGRMSLSNELWLRQVEGGAGLAQADQARRAAQQWIILILEQDKTSFDARTDLWSQPLPPIPASWGLVYGQIEDLQGRFNLNNLVNEGGEPDSTALRRFERLLTILELDPGIAQSVTDWIDADGRQAGPWGAEDGFYIGLDPPYLAANHALGDPAELRLVRGVDQQAWERLEPHVTALPRRTPLNVNTATPEVLAAAMTTWGAPRPALAMAQHWALATDQSPFTDIATFFAQALETPGGNPDPELSVASAYFMAETHVSFGRVSYSTTTTYERRDGRVTILRHARQL